LQASRWQLRFAETDPAILERAVDALLQRDVAEVTRVTKGGPRTFDVRAAIVSAIVSEVESEVETDGDPRAGATPASQAGNQPRFEPGLGPGPAGAPEPRRERGPADVSRSASVRAPGGTCAILQLVVRHTTPAVRPDDVLTALRAVADFESAHTPRVLRLAQGPLDVSSGFVADPLAPACEALVTDVDGVPDDAALSREPDRT